MPFDQKTRNLLQRTVSACRRILDEEFAAQRRGTYGINDDGTAASLAKLTHLPDEDMQVARLLRDRLDHLVAGLVAQGKKEADARKEAVGRITREQAFTVLNRLAALRMSEEREIVLECVRHGLQSEGFLLFQQSSGSAFGDTWMTYRAYLFVLFDELAVDLGVLFSRWDPAGLLFPRQEALEAVLKELGGTGTATAREEISPEEFNAIWSEDETIGWIYQYYNDPAERKKMRDESSAPRNSRELAVRNQFFTPRYVVEFLTDNTLGRIWYEMTKGKTRLKDQCRYLVRRPVEVFLVTDFQKLIFKKDDWVAEVARTAYFSNLPENPLIEELARFALMIDGYALMEKLEEPFAPTGPEHAIQSFIDRFCNPQLEESEKGPHAWHGNAAELWCCLFVIQRKSWRECWRSLGGGQLRETDRASDDSTARDIWPALRQALQHPPENLSQEDLLKQPVFIPHRPLKDPRSILMIDPACGSMHFGLYAFDLFEVIYEEAWDQSGSSDLRPLASDFPSKEVFLREVPRLIIEHNIHGIDIDPRCAQIAGLSLWLRAQKAWQRLGLNPALRPTIKKSNIVCAEPMPGEKGLLHEFIVREFPAEECGVFLRLLETIFDKMQLAGEAGSLLKIEEEISSAIASAKQSWKEGPKLKQAKLFGEGESIVQKDLPMDLSGITDEQFWERAEHEIYGALEKYAEQAENGGGFQRRLFAEDAARGFAFIDVCRKRYDVAVMNPPFGNWSSQFKTQSKRTYPDSSNDILAAFVDRGSQLLHSGGKIGAITSRTCFFLSSFKKWRENIVLGALQPESLVDLGHGVMDAAMVEAAAYTMSKKVSKSASAMLCIRLLNDKDPPAALGEAVIKVRKGKPAADTFSIDPVSFQQIPNAPFAYWTSENLFRLFVKFPSFEEDGKTVRVGLQTSDDFRVVRIWWEVAPPKQNTFQDREWKHFLKGDSASSFYDDIHYVINWKDDGRYIKEWKMVDLAMGRITANNSKCWNESKYFLAGMSWALRTSSFKPSCVPKDCIPSVSRYLATSEYVSVMAAIALCNSKVFDFLCKLCVERHGHPKFIPGVVRAIPYPKCNQIQESMLESMGLMGWSLKRRNVTQNITSHAFYSPALSPTRRTQSCNFSQGGTISSIRCEPLQNSLGAAAKAWSDGVAETIDKLTKIQRQIDELAYDLYEIGLDDRYAIETMVIQNSNITAEEDDEEDEDEECMSVGITGVSELVSELIDYAMGCCFGRWNVLCAAGEKEPPLDPDPFAPLPVCPPGMLQNTAGLPAAPCDVPAIYPVPITWSGILVDDANDPDDIERRLREVFTVIFPDRTDAILQEACELLGVKSLREWARKPAGLFADHLKRYSKSRRQAPIYWPLSTASGCYTLWIYYHRLDGDTLYKCLQQFVDPKIGEVGKDIHRLRTMLAADEAGTKERKQLADAESLLTELREFHADLSHWAPRWKPNLNDGVQITACPLWKLFRLPKWQKTLKETWQDLEKGDYDWAHLALTLWPDRVRNKCKKDRSLAIAHDLEDLCEIKAPEPKKKEAKKAGKKAAKVKRTTGNTGMLDGFL